MEKPCIVMKNPGLEYIPPLQKALYAHLNQFSKSHPYIGRLGALPIAIIDVGLEVIKNLTDTLIEIALKIHNLFRPAIKLESTNGPFVDLTLTIGYGILSPIFVIRKFRHILKDPTSAVSTLHFPYDAERQKKFVVSN